MNITIEEWEKYINNLRKINDKASDLVRKYLTANGLPTTKAEMNALIEYAFAVCNKYGEASAEIAAEMYDTLAELYSMFLDPAVPAELPAMEEVAKAIVGTVKIGNEEIVAGAVGRLVKRAGVDTTLQNAIRDGAEFAWIPHGETCPFCIMLASNGWQTASKKALKGGHAEHIHANCDCTYAIRFGDGMTYDFYDAAKYKEIYDNAEGRKWRDKLNSMRSEYDGVIIA